MSGLEEVHAVLARIAANRVKPPDDQPLTASDAIRAGALARIAREREVARQVALLARTTRPDIEEPACVNASTR